ncbi:MAG TPA: large-conductance mechanosensitive channel protein MscL [Chitinophagaceae bacterium]|nr:large-conductance mechanosensitive channel protein MscL [Chitinophagaceae bacterium]
MSFFKDFKAFAMKGNVIDLAVAVVIGAAFGAIINSLVKDIIMPVIGVLTGGISFTDKKVVLTAAVTDAAGKIIKPENALTYGNFIQASIDFLLIALAIFVMIRLIARLTPKPAPPAPAGPTTTEQLLMEIRDLLKK